MGKELELILAWVEAFQQDMQQDGALWVVDSCSSNRIVVASDTFGFGFLVKVGQMEEACYVVDDDFGVQDDSFHLHGVHLYVHLYDHRGYYIYLCDLVHLCHLDYDDNFDGHPGNDFVQYVDVVDIMEAEESNSG